MIELHAAQSRQLYADWKTRRRGRLFPARADFDPLELRYIIGNLSLLDVIRDPLRFRYRVHSTNMAEWLGYDLTGKDIDMSPKPGRGTEIKDHFARVVESGEPLARVHEWLGGNHRTLKHEALVLPLASDGITIDMIMSAVSTV
jgi:hypothetical protein